MSDEAAILLICIREVLSSKLSQDTCYTLSVALLSCSRYTWERPQYKPQLGSSTPFPVRCLLLILLDAIRSY